jgi:high affinity sulfate transporter 1
MTSQVPTDTAGPRQNAAGNRLARWLPVTGWLPSYSAGWLAADVVAGVTLGAYLLPAALGDASLANLPPAAGLYACLMSGLVFWVFCSSRRTAITVTSGISLLVGQSLGELAGGDAARFWALASCTSLLVGLLALITWAIRAGVIVNFVSETVLLGFKAGIAFVLASTQLPKLFGFSAAHSDFWGNSWHFIKHLPETNPAALVTGVVALAILLVGKWKAPRQPVAIVVVVGSILASALLDLEARGVKMLGEVPQGLPVLGFPAVYASDINALLPLAMACFLLGAVESVAIGRMFAVKHRLRFDANQEFLALSAANLASGLGRGFPVGGGMSQSLVNESAGAKTPLSGLVCAVVVLLVMLYCSALLRDLPTPALAAIILVAVTGLIKPAAIKRLWRFSRTEFSISLAATIGVLGSGVLRGVLIGVVLSVLLLLRRARKPDVVELGRIPGTDQFGDRARNPEFAVEPDVLAVRPEGGLFYFNAEFVRDQIAELLSRRQSIRLVIINMATVPQVDLAAAEMLLELRDELSHDGVELVLIEARGQVRDALRRADYEVPDGTAAARRSVALAVAHWRQRSGQKESAE